MKREMLWLVAGVVLVDAVFVALYFLAELRNSSDMVKVGFTVVWTLVTVVVVLRGLSRIRQARLESRNV